MMDCFNADVFCGHCNTAFDAKSGFYQYCPCREARLSQTEENVQRGIMKGIC